LAFHGVRQVYAVMHGGLTLPDATFYSSADRSAVLDEYGIRIHELCMLARMSAAAANSTAHAAIAFEAAMARVLRSDARQSQQLPKCVDRPMAWVCNGVLSALQGPLGTQSWQLHMPAAQR
jgi:predicted metalloendopeptidase